MRQPLIPIAVGLLAGLSAGSGYAYMRLPGKAAISSDIALNHQSADERMDSQPTSSVGTTSDSIRNVVPDTGGTSPVMVAVADTATVRVDNNTRTGRGNTPPPPAASGDKAIIRKDTADTSDATAEAGISVATIGAASAAAVVKSARDAALNTPLPDQRLAKIFSAMSAKDAARVLDQMTDNDIRTILSHMNDRQAAAILASLSASRAAAITRNVNKADNTP